MPDEYELQSATNLAVTLAWVAGAVVAAYDREDALRLH